MTSSRRFRFVQFEFPWALGPEPGRYPIRERMGEAPEYVFVLLALGAPERRLMTPRRRASRDVPPDPPPEPVQTSRATLIDTDGLLDLGAAEGWLREAEPEGLAGAALARLNRIVYAHRVAAADPYAREVTREQALVTRIGFGTGDHVADGRWERARELAPAGRGGGVAGAARAREAVLRPQERVAAVLCGREALLACEELALRARSDLDAGRYREAALQLRTALDAALAELEPWRERPSLPERLEELHARRGEVEAAAKAALTGGLDPEHIEAVQSVLGRIEAALRARTASGVG